jgi:hypothetical protein
LCSGNLRAFSYELDALFSCLGGFRRLMEERNFEEYYPNIAAAAIDICGMGVLVNKGDECKSAMRTIELLVKNTILQRGAYKTLPVQGKPDIFLHHISSYFGDSVYLFANPQNDLKTQVDLLAINCSGLLATGLSLGFVVRAGICIGDLRKSVLNLGDGKIQELRIGTSMVQAHKLQESQRWVGGAIDTSIPSTDIYRFEYPIPIKTNSHWHGKNLQVINWVCALKDMSKLNSDKREYQNEEKMKQRVQKVVSDVGAVQGETEERLTNTLKFIDYAFENKKYL